jgi:phenylalanine-4-hydroxylase
LAAFESAVASLPSHLARYVAEQDYSAYTPRDQAVWRHILRRLTAHLKDKAHPSYLSGLAAAGIGTERIPTMAEMNACLGRLGWSAVPVRGFIPPAVFTELQSRGVLAIAADIRSHEHVDYTPAPDIVHESAGHAPILRDARYAEYLKRCGVAGFKAIASREDRALHDAVRGLSVVKEDPEAGPAETATAEERLAAALAARTWTSESARASRLYWWTAEYGLVGSLDRPKLYGAGLLSSLKEAGHCLTDAVERLPLSLACVDQDFDITRMQPRLFVARDFEHLFEVLEQFEATLAWKRGGAYGLEQAERAGTVNHLLLDDGLELTGTAVRHWQAGDVLLARLDGPAMVSRRGRSLGGAPWQGAALALVGPLPPEPEGIGPFAFTLPGGLRLAGTRLAGHRVEALRASLDGRALDLPDSALLVSSRALPGVAGGPADPESWDAWFGEREPAVADEAEQRARRAKAAALPPRLGHLYLEVAAMRRAGRIDHGRLGAIRAELEQFPEDWLLREEVGELLAPDAP